MEPPAKRLRILQSVDVDETDPDYVNAKQKQQQKFKGRLESIFAKYENMHESMSDEIDMRENRVVVDRGHLRRLVRQVNRKETVLLDNLGLAAGKDLEEQSEQEDDKECSEDELAPTQTPQMGGGRSKKELAAKQTALPVVHSTPSNPNQTEIRTAHPFPGADPVSITPNPTANLLQLIQFPQTPEGQQAQKSFYETISQTINQAVQQAVAPLFSGILPNVPSPYTSSLPVPATPQTNGDKITPATDPKWHFPPLSNESRMLEVAQSSPILASTQSQSASREVSQVLGVSNARGQENKEIPVEISEDVQDSSTSVVAILHSVTNMKPAGNIRRSHPRVEIQRKHRTQKKYHFTEEDDIYMSGQKVIHNRTWPEIKDSQKKWREWPIGTFYKRWNQQLKGRNLHWRYDPAVQSIWRDSQISEDEIVASPYRHLPTPSSMDHEDGCEEARRYPTELLTSSTHFDEDERELLSLAGADLEEESAPVEDEEACVLHPDDIILPSVEDDLFDEEPLLQDSLGDLPTHAVIGVVERASTPFKAEKEPSPPPDTSRQRRHPNRKETMPDLDLESNPLTRVGSSSSPHQGTFACNVRGAVFKNVKNLQCHEANSRSTHDKLSPRSASIDLVGDDELQDSASVTPHIKREFSTPPPTTSLLFSTPAPRSRAHPHLLSSGVKSASGLSNKEYRKQVKQSWSKMSTPGPKTLYKRRSLHAVPRKREWAGGGSEDELGM